MMLLTRKNLSFIPRSTKTLSFVHSAFTSPAIQTPPPKSQFILEYLIRSCGFSPEKAAKTLKPIANLTSPSIPDSVRHFLKHNGFSETHIRNLISGYPRLLCSDVDQTLQPNLHALRELGFTEQELQKLILRNPQALTLRSTIPRILFWRTFLNGDSKKLVMAFSRNRGLINHDIDKTVVAKISLLKEHGLSEIDIRRVIVSGRGLFVRSSAAMEVLIKRAQELGFHPGSPVFVGALSTLSSLGSDQFMGRMELFRSFGWSEGEFLAAFKKTPSFARLTEENLKEKKEFLVARAGCAQSYIVSRPAILNYSLEKRLKPRHCVMNILKSNELIGKEWDFYYVVSISEKKFVDTFILRFKNEAPTLLKDYNAACSGKFSL